MDVPANRNEELNEVRLDSLINDVGHLRAKPFKSLINKGGRREHISSRSFRSYSKLVRAHTLGPHKLRITKMGGLKLSSSMKLGNYYVRTTTWFGGDDINKPLISSRMHRTTIGEDNILSSEGGYDLRFYTNTFETFLTYFHS